MPPNGKPNNADLKQMFVYNVQFDASESVLLYPHVEGCATSNSHYVDTVRLPNWQHHCWMRYTDLFARDGKVRPNAGNDLLKELI